MTKFPASVLTGAAPDPDAELLALERECAAVSEEWGKAENLSDDEFDDYSERYAALQNKIRETPAHGISGLLVKWRYVRYWGDGESDGLDRACESFEAALLAYARRAQL